MSLIQKLFPKKMNASDRKNIFDFLSAKKEIRKEVQKIANLYESENLVDVCTGLFIESMSLEEYMRGLFRTWKGRDTYLSLKEFKNDMGIANIQTRVPDEQETILYLEYLLNMLELLERTKQSGDIPSTISIQATGYLALSENLTRILSQLNLKAVNKTRDIFILIPKDPAVTEVVEIVEKSDVKLAILEYNHITNRNNLAEKQKILTILARDFEPRRLELEEMKEWKSLASDLGFLFNTLDIRHNNTEGKKAVPAIQNMPEKDLLKWYDTTYRLYLTAVLLHDYSNEEQQEKITALKAAVNPR